MATQIPARHELKYFINYGEYAHLSRTLDYLLHRDPNGDEFNEYHIRSLYFDTIFDTALTEKISGVGNRRKYRLRIYKLSDKKIRLECKQKFGDLIHKQSVDIPRELAEQLIACDPSGLEKTDVPLLHDVYREMKLNLLRPAVIVDYVREAYTHPAEDVRITFDKQLRTGVFQKNLFDPYLPTINPLDDPWLILEVKYNRAMPEHIRCILNQVTGQRSAISKYVLCRRFEGREY